MEQEPLFSFYTSTLYHILYKAYANALAIGAYRLAPSRPSINHKLMNFCKKQYEQPRQIEKTLARAHGGTGASYPRGQSTSAQAPAILTWRRAIWPLFSTVNGKNFLSWYLLS